MENREERQRRIMHDGSCQTNLVSLFADRANVVDKGKREKSQRICSPAPKHTFLRMKMMPKDFYLFYIFVAL